MTDGYESWWNVGIATTSEKESVRKACEGVMEGRKEEFQTLIRKAYNFVIVIALPLMLFTIFYARDCLVFLQEKSLLEQHWRCRLLHQQLF